MAFSAEASPVSGVPEASLGAELEARSCGRGRFHCPRTREAQGWTHCYVPSTTSRLAHRNPTAKVRHRRPRQAGLQRPAASRRFPFLQSRRCPTPVANVTGPKSRLGLPPRPAEPSANSQTLAVSQNFLNRLTLTATGHAGHSSRLSGSFGMLIDGCFGGLMAGQAEAGGRLFFSASVGRVQGTSATPSPLAFAAVTVA